MGKKFEKLLDDILACICVILGSYFFVAVAVGGGQRVRDLKTCLLPSWITPCQCRGNLGLVNEIYDHFCNICQMVKWTSAFINLACEEMSISISFKWD